MMSYFRYFIFKVNDLQLHKLPAVRHDVSDISFVFCPSERNKQPVQLANDHANDACERLAIYAPRFLPTLGRPHTVALHSASFVVINLRRDLHPHDCAHVSGVNDLDAPIITFDDGRPPGPHRPVTKVDPEFETVI